MVTISGFLGTLVEDLLTRAGLCLQRIPIDEEDCAGCSVLCHLKYPGHDAAQEVVYGLQ